MAFFGDVMTVGGILALLFGLRMAFMQPQMCRAVD